MKLVIFVKQAIITAIVTMIVTLAFVPKMERTFRYGNKEEAFRKWSNLGRQPGGASDDNIEGDHIRSSIDSNLKLRQAHPFLHDLLQITKFASSLRIVPLDIYPSLHITSFRRGSRYQISDPGLVCRS